MPSDPAVLTAAVSLHDLGEHYRLARRRRRTTGALPLTSKGLIGFRSRVSGCTAAGAGSKASTSQRSSLMTALMRSIMLSTSVFRQLRTMPDWRWGRTSNCCAPGASGNERADVHPGTDGQS